MPPRSSTEQADNMHALLQQQAELMRLVQQQSTALETTTTRLEALESQRTDELGSRSPHGRGLSLFASAAGAGASGESDDQFDAAPLAPTNEESADSCEPRAPARPPTQPRFGGARGTAALDVADISARLSSLASHGSTAERAAIASLLGEVPAAVDTGDAEADAEALWGQLDELVPGSAEDTGSYAEAFSGFPLPLPHVTTGRNFNPFTRDVPFHFATVHAHPRDIGDAMQGGLVDALSSSYKANSYEARTLVCNLSYQWDLRESLCARQRRSSCRPRLTACFRRLSCTSRRPP